RQNAVSNLVGRIALYFGAALDAKRLAATGVKKPQVVVDFSSCGDRRAGIARRVLLANGYGRGDAGDVVHVRFFHALQELARVGREGFYVAALPFRIDGVERQRGFTGAADAGDYRDFVVRDIDADVFQVVSAGAADSQRLRVGKGCGRVRGDEFVRS